MPRLRVSAARSAFLAAALLIAANAGTQTGIPPDANVKGMWSAVAPWPVIGIHAVLLPGGRVLTYGNDTSGRQTGFFTYDVWDPEGCWCKRPHRNARKVCRARASHRSDYGGGGAFRCVGKSVSRILEL